MFDFNWIYKQYYFSQFGCYVAVFSGLNLLLSLKKIPYIGIYIIMVEVLFKSFIKVVIPIYLCLTPFVIHFHLNLGSTVC